MKEHFAAVSRRTSSAARRRPGPSSSVAMTNRLTRLSRSRLFQRNSNLPAGSCAGSIGSNSSAVLPFGIEGAPSGTETANGLPALITESASSSPSQMTSACRPSCSAGSSRTSAFQNVRRPPSRCQNFLPAARYFADTSRPPSTYGKTRMFPFGSGTTGAPDSAQLPECTPYFDAVSGQMRRFSKP